MILCANESGVGCVLCGTKSGRMISGMDAPAMLFCRHCRALYRFPLPDKAAYLAQVDKQYSRLDPYEDVAASRGKLFKLFLKRANSLFPQRGRLLDIGCGCGTFLEIAAREGWSTHGIEINPRLAGLAGHVCSDIRCGDIDSVEFPDNFFDVVTLWNVFDEIMDPIGCLEKVRRILKPGGLLFIRVINLDFHGPIDALSRSLRQCGLGWVLPKDIQIFHVFNFSRRAMNRILQDHHFKNICVSNAYLTVGDPYKKRRSLGLLKSLVFLGTQGIYFMTAGRVLVGPSLDVYAQNGKD